MWWDWVHWHCSLGLVSCPDGDDDEKQIRSHWYTEDWSVLVVLVLESSERKIFLIVTLSSTNPTWAPLGVYMPSTLRKRRLTTWNMVRFVVTLVHFAKWSTFGEFLHLWQCVEEITLRVDHFSLSFVHVLCYQNKKVQQRRTVWQ
jgi:hypothetical protein